MALQASGARMSRQTRFLREGVEDQLILEKAKGPDGMSREQIESRIVVPRHTIFVQFSRSTSCRSSSLWPGISSLRCLASCKS